MTLPNFLIIGAAKAGTTSLYHYLAQHPQIFMSPVKEPNFFAFDGTKPRYGGPVPTLNLDAVVRLDDYEALFDGVSDEIAIGEATPRYIWTDGAPRNIKALIPEAKLIAVLRNPVERAFSDFTMNLRNGVEPYSDFAMALQDEPKRLQDNWQQAIYVHRGFYHQQLKKYYELFNKSQIKIYLYEDYISDPLTLLKDTFGFLDVNPTFLPDMAKKYNPGGIIKNPILRFCWTRSQPLRDKIRPVVPKQLRSSVATFFTDRTLIKPVYPQELQAQLAATYWEDILRLQELIDRDLSAWLVPSENGAHVPDSVE